MGLRDLFQRVDPYTGAVVGAAQTLDLEQGQAPTVKREDWQTKAFSYYDQIPELWFATNYIANALRRVRLFPAIQPDPQQPPIPLDPAVDGPLAVRAQLEIDRLRSKDGSHGAVISGLAVQLSIPGEGFLVGLTDEFGVEEFDVYSMDECRFDASTKKWKLYDGPQDRTGTDLDPLNSFAARMWRRHPRWRNMADSGMRAVLDECEELLILAKYFRSVGRSRMNNGVFLWPSEATMPAQRSPAGTGGQKFSDDPLLNAYLNMAITAIQDEGSAAAVAPSLMKISSKYIEMPRHLLFDRPYDDTAMARELRLIQRVANGLDIPAEVILGLENLNHWSAWQITEDGFDNHLAPLMDTIVSGLTEGFLRPAMSDTANNTALVWYDASALISHPNKGTDADAAIKIGGIGYDAYRRYKGYTEEDAPTEEDLEMLERILTAGRPAGPDGGGAAGPPAASITAAAGLSLPQFNRQWNRINTHLSSVLYNAAQSAAHKAIQLLTQGMEAHNAVADHQQLSLQGYAAGRFQDDEDYETLVTSAGGVFRAETAAAQRRMRDLVNQYQTDNSIDWANVAEQQEQERNAGAALFIAGIGAAVGARVLGSSAAVPKGEYNPNTIVPADVVRTSLNRAGGGSGSVRNAHDEPMGEIAYGQTALELLAQVAVTPSAWEWVTGSPGEPFLGHEVLNGVRFLDWQDDVLQVAAEDDWLGVDHYFPGDHNYCQCDFIGVLTSTAGD